MKTFVGNDTKIWDIIPVSWYLLGLISKVLNIIPVSRCEKGTLRRQAIKQTGNLDVFPKIVLSAML